VYNISITFTSRHTIGLSLLLQRIATNKDTVTGAEVKMSNGYSNMGVNLYESSAGEAKLPEWDCPCQPGCGYYATYKVDSGSMKL
jgi:hypothetical protein